MKKGLVLVLAVLFCVSCVSADKVRQTNAVSVVLKTLDGSSIVGHPVKADIAIETAFGRMSLPLAILKGIECDPSTTNTIIQFINGDRLSGMWNDGAFLLATSFGEQKVDLSRIRSIVNRSGCYREGLILHYAFDRDDGDSIKDIIGANDGVTRGIRWIPNGKVGGAIEFRGRAQNSGIQMTSTTLHISITITITS